MLQKKKEEKERVKKRESQFSLIVLAIKYVTQQKSQQTFRTEQITAKRKISKTRLLIGMCRRKRWQKNNKRKHLPMPEKKAATEQFRVKLRFNAFSSFLFIHTIISCSMVFIFRFVVLCLLLAFIFIFRSFIATFAAVREHSGHTVFFL